MTRTTEDLFEAYSESLEDLRNIRASIRDAVYNDFTAQELADLSERYTNLQRCFDDCKFELEYAEYERDVLKIDR